MSTIKSSAEHLTLNADGASKDIKFQANGVEKASISSAGAFTSTTIDATALTGTIPNFTSTGIDDNATAEKLDITDTIVDVLTGAKVRAVDGILFGADTAAANALDDYEEGTFTATLTGHTSDPSTAVTETAYYTKVGNVVQIAITFNNKDTSGAVGNVRVTGLPFTSKSGEPRYPLSAVFYHRFTWDTDRTAYMLIPDDTTYMYAYALKGDTTWEQVTHSAGTGMHLWISGTYLT